MSSKIITIIDVAKFEISKVLASIEKSSNFIVVFSHIFGKMSDVRVVMRNVDNKLTCSVSLLDASCYITDGAVLEFECQALKFTDKNKKNFYKEAKK